jgi:hypothetical protein
VLCFFQNVFEKLGNVVGLLLYNMVSYPQYAKQWVTVTRTLGCCRSDSLRWCPRGLPLDVSLLLLLLLLSSGTKLYQPSSYMVAQSAKQEAASY